MALTNQFVKDMHLLIEGTIYHVVDRQLKTQGRQGGLIILKLRNLNTGNILVKTIKAGVKLDTVDLETKELQYLYTDDANAQFMDTETYETVPVKKSILGDYLNFLKEGEKILGLFYEGNALSVRKNPTVVLEVIDSEEAVKGDTATNATKEVTVETGYKIHVPLFVNKGDKIKINTESCEYMGKAN